MTYDLLLVGCGNMAGAMLSGWLEAGLIGHAIVVKPSPLAFSHPAVRVVTPADGVPHGFRPDMVVLGVKPQMLGEVLPAYAPYAGTAPFLSLAAGKTLAYFERQLGPAAQVIRTMPNLPATVRKGVTGCVAGANVTEAQRNVATTLLAAVGTVHWIDEPQMDALTALSGSGPAYLFLMEEVLAQAGKKLGLAADLAAALARATIVGAAELLNRSQEDAATLRARVTSKEGVTEAAIKVLLKDDALSELFAAALAANVKRAGELLLV